MSNERKDEFLSWRGRLDTPEGIPGQGLDDREATWQRLVDRFGDKPRRRSPVRVRRLVLYAIVAACLLLAVNPASLLFRHRSHRFRSGGIAETTPPVARPGEKTGVSTPPPAAITSITLRSGRPADGGDRETANGSVKRVDEDRNKTGVRIEMRPVAVIDDTHHSLEASPAPLLSQIPPAGTAPQKKWKVIDLNDLGPGQGSPYRMASGRREPYFRIGLGSIDPPGIPDPGGRPADAPGIRIKISSSN